MDISSDGALLIIDGKTVELGAFCIPDMGLSWSRSRMTRCQFEFTLPVDTFKNLAGAEYRELAAELLADDKQYGGDADSPLSVNNWPDLETVVGSRALLDEVIYYLGPVVIRTLCGENGSKRYWEDSIDGARCVEHGGKMCIQITGICYR